MELAKHFQTCVLSADSRQFYKEISIGTAKPTEKEQQGIKHYFINSHSLEDEVTSAEYEKLALEVLDSEFKSNDVIILVGGSGMFVDALCNGLDDIPTDPKVKQEIVATYESQGLEPLLKELQEKDPDFFGQVDKDNAPRVQRAVEAIRITGKPFSKLRTGHSKQRPFKVHRFVLDHNRQKLYDRINLRVDKMMEEGLEDEVRSVEQFRHLTSMNTVGYKELFSYFDGKITREEAIELIKQNSRRYAKRQLTWLRRNTENHWIDFTDIDSVVREILTIFEAHKN